MPEQRPFRGGNDLQPPCVSLINTHTRQDFAGVPAQVSRDSAKRPWTILMAGFAEDSLYALLRDVAVLLCVGPAVMKTFGSAGFLILYIAGEHIHNCPVLSRHHTFPPGRPADGSRR